MGKLLRRFARFAAVAVVLTACLPEPSQPQPKAPPPEPGSLTGWLLVAAPSMPDPRFKETVIFMLRHGEDGAMGLVVNRAVGRGPIAEVLEKVGLDGEGVEGDISIHYGGPVKPGTGFVLHSSDYAVDGTIPVTDSVSVTVDPEVLRAIGVGAGPKRSLFAVGYAGWGPGQLDDEIRRKDWFTVPPDDRIVFDGDTQSKWDRAIARRGVDL